MKSVVKGASSVYLQHSVFLCVLQNEFTPSEVVQWSNHRVMEWLRSVDLAEYAPNLRGSGVHGGLVVSTRDHTVYGLKHHRKRPHYVSPLIDSGASV